MPGGTQSAGPYELRLPIFLQPLGGALKNRSATPASPPCFRRRRTGCGTQHPLRLACVSLAAAPTTPCCFRRWRRSSSLQSAPMLFSSTRLCESDICAKENRQCISTLAVFSWARVDYASRASKKAPQGPFCRRDVKRRPMLFESTLESETSVFYKTKSPAYFRTLSIFGGRGWITQAALLKTAHWAVFALSSATAPQLFESTLGYALKSFGQKKNSSIFTTLEFLVERSQPNPNHCPLGHRRRQHPRKRWFLCRLCS